MILFEALSENIKMAIQHDLVYNQYLPAPLNGEVLDVIASKTEPFYIAPKPDVKAFLLKVFLNKNPNMDRYYERHVGYVGGREAGSDAPVDADQTKRQMKDVAFVKGYFRYNNQLGLDRVDSMWIVMHPTQVPQPSISHKIIELSTREREILYCFGVLKTSMRKQALFRLDVSNDELNALLVKGALRSSSHGYELSRVGEFNKSSMLSAPKSGIW